LKGPCAHGFLQGCGQALGLARIPEWCEPCRHSYREWLADVLVAQVVEQQPPCPLTDVQQEQYQCWLAFGEPGRPAWSYEQVQNSVVEPN
jgi:hypothetical protein